MNPKQLIWALVFASFTFSAAAFGFAYSVENKVVTVRCELSDHATKQAETTITKDDLLRLENNINKRLDSIETKLDKKVDKK